MKNQILRAIAAGVLSATLVSNSFTVFATEEIPIETNADTSNTNTEAISKPTEPSQPTIEGEITNEKINTYNQEVNNYNQQVDEYNNQVDEYNNQIDTQYEEEKANIDAQNQAINEHNQAEDEKAAAIKTENEQIQAQYEEDLAQYETDMTTYQQKEQQILNLGYESVEQYNNTVNTYYNEPAKEGLEKNADENNTFDIEQSYEIESAATGDSSDSVNEEEASEPAPAKKYKVEIEHNFNDGETLVESYKTEFEIDETDIITFKPAGAQLDTLDNPYHYGFFAKTDENHLSGYWYLGYSILQSLCNYHEESWDNGDVHTLSYKDGERTSGDTTLTMVYNYFWKALRQVKTYAKPEEPTLELKEEYEPQYEENIPDPVKEEYLNHLDYLSILDLLPEPTPAPTEESKEETSEPTSPTVTIEEEATPTTSTPVKEVLGEEREKINTEKIVLGAARQAQTSDENYLLKRSVIIISCIAIIGLLLFVDFINKKRKS